MPFPYPILDAHCDTLTRGDLDDVSNQFRVSDMAQYASYIQICAVCAEHNDAVRFAPPQCDLFWAQTQRYALTPILSRNDLSARRGVLLAIEGADALGGRLEALYTFFRRGVRLMTLTWNYDNAAASSIASERDDGLTEFGARLVREMEHLGMVVDLSHCSDRTFDCVVQVATKPFVCSHSNSRTINGAYRRNITDDQFRTLMRCGGVTGINFCTDFLGGAGDLSAILRHIEHFCALGGEENVGFGSDFDGIPVMPLGCRGAAFFADVLEALLRLNYSEEAVCAIAGGNFRRVLGACLPAAKEDADEKP